MYVVQIEVIINDCIFILYVEPTPLANLFIGYHRNPMQGFLTDLRENRENTV